MEGNGNVEQRLEYKQVCKFLKTREGDLELLKNTVCYCLIQPARSTDIMQEQEKIGQICGVYQLNKAELWVQKVVCMLQYFIRKYVQDSSQPNIEEIEREGR